MMFKLLKLGCALLIVLPLITTSCKTSKSGEKDTYTYWVNSARVPCVGVGPMECLQIRKGESEDWQLFYSDIEGFDFEPGYLYRLRVREEKLDLAQVPADASSIRFILIAIEEKTPDPKR